MHGSGESLSVEDSNRKYTTTSDATKGTSAPADAAQTIYFPTNGDTRDFIAYYPWQKTLGTDGRTYTVDVTDQKVQNLIDLLGAGKVTGKDKDHPQVALTFTHKLVKIALDIQAGNGPGQQGTRGYGNNPDRTADKCPIRRCGGGEVVIPEEGEETGIELLTAADGTAAEAIVLPVEDTEGMYLVFDIPDVGTFNWRVKVHPNRNPSRLERNIYIPLRINRMSVEVESSVTDWQPGNGEGETGSAE